VDGTITDMDKDKKPLITDYQQKYQSAFKDLNVEWISKYFRMEKADHDTLDDPEGYIVNKGGHILVALLDNKTIGVCALIKMKDDRYDYELAKMAVSPGVQGMGIGFQLGKACIEKAKQLGAEWLYLESNTVLEPAISLYRKLGFTEVTGRETPYERCNIQMELRIM
jgi:GNAT superfamily N-acetyltransferase